MTGIFISGYQKPELTVDQTVSDGKNNHRRLKGTIPIRILNYFLERLSIIIRGLKMVSKIYMKREIGWQNSSAGTIKYISIVVLSMLRLSNGMMVWIANY
jgi:hypothetical protein